MEAITAEYAKVLRIARKDTMASILENLNQNKASGTYFTDLVPSLEIMAIENGADIRIGRSGRKGRNEIIPEPIAEGAFGELFKNRSGTVIYKKIFISGEIPQKKEFMVRQTFLEAFIQTVLGMDPTYGKNVCHIQHVYRAAESVRPMARRNGSTDIILYIVMEPIAHTLEDKLDALGSNGALTLKMLSPYFAQLGHVLEGLKHKYNFFHSDLHTGNVMFRDDDTTTLIDFGACCLRINDVTYAVNQDNIVHPNARRLIAGVVDAPCESYDVLMFLASFAENYGAALSEEENVKLMRYLDTRDKSFNLLDWLFRSYTETPIAERPKALFHMTYNRVIKEEWPRDVVAKLPNIPGITPGGFAAMSEGFGRDMRNRDGGARRTRRGNRRGRMTRKYRR
jgi:succinate dehydrogenase flavin-adding protein (antitoxin of CptAB toxin-antitoxin module)